MDGGLASCLKLTGVHDQYVEILRKKGIKTLRDLASGLTAEDYKEQLDKVWKSIDRCRAGIAVALLSSGAGERWCC